MRSIIEVAKQGNRKFCRSTKKLQDIIAILGMEELSDEDKATVMQSKKDSEILVTAILRC